MAHGLKNFRVTEIVDKADGALRMLEAAQDGDAATDAIQEAVRVALENQMKIAETLELIKVEFDKFEKGLDAIL